MNVLDLFCGAGGLTEGLSQSGFKTVAGIDINPDAIKTFQLNHTQAKGFCLDIQSITEDWLSQNIAEPIDLICGGPPCQGFSTIGRNDPSDVRNQLPQEFLRIVGIVLPQWVLIENVPGLASKRQSEHLNHILASLEGLGYKTEWMILNAHLYNVAQTRKRLFIFAHRGQSSKTVTVPVEAGVPSLAEAWEKYLSDHNHKIEKAQIKNKLERERITFIPPGRSIRYQKDEQELLPYSLWFDVNWDLLRENRFREAKLHRLSLEQPSPTISTSYSSYYHPLENRYLTVREAAAIQSFPGNFGFTGNSVTGLWKQVGNAVPPELARRIGLAIID